MPIVDEIYYEVWDKPYAKIGARIAPLDATLREALEDDISGISVGPDEVIVHFLEIEQVSIADGIVAGHAVLMPEASQSSIDADGVDESVITVSGLTSFDYKVWLDGEVVAAGSIGDGSLEFSTDTAGLYLIEVIDGDNTGYAEVIANG